MTSTVTNAAPRRDPDILASSLLTCLSRSFSALRPDWHASGAPDRNPTMTACVVPSVLRSDPARRWDHGIDGHPATQPVRTNITDLLRMSPSLDASAGGPPVGAAGQASW